MSATNECLIIFMHECVWAGWSGLCVKMDSCVCEGVCLCVVSICYMFMSLSVYLHVCFHGCPVGGFGCSYTVYVCVGEGGQATERLYSEEEFCSADDYTCRADATPAAGALAAKVTEPGWHGEGPKGIGKVCAFVSLCEVMQ